MSDWKLFLGNCGDTPRPLRSIPDRPPWREFLPPKQVDSEADEARWQKLQAKARQDPRAVERGSSFRIEKNEDGHSEIVDAVNAAIHLRRPLLVTGNPGSGKTSLAYAIAYELQLGPVLVWPITARSTLKDALYRYDAIARLQDAQIDKAKLELAKLQGQEDTQQLEALKEESSLGDYFQLGSVGTAFLPSHSPRVLLIDEIDKSDLNLPNDLLNLFEEGQFEIPELVRRKGHVPRVTVRTEDDEIEAEIENGKVRCCEFPVVVMTSNGERDFPPAFLRRCLRLRMPDPTPNALHAIVRSHFNRSNLQPPDTQPSDADDWQNAKSRINELIKAFREGNKADRATDQLLNAVYLMTREAKPDDEEWEELRKLLFRRLSEGDR
ncbi:MAG: AAA family ATPase [Cyanobacteria bacterium SID2]|nr:AAA family ATPase [Cyanobacteria bacterium SID2]